MGRSLAKEEVEATVGCVQPQFQLVGSRGSAGVSPASPSSGVPKSWVYSFCVVRHLGSVMTWHNSPTDLETASSCSLITLKHSKSDAYQEAISADFIN